MRKQKELKQADIFAKARGPRRRQRANKRKGNRRAARHYDALLIHGVADANPFKGSRNEA